MNGITSAETIAASAANAWDILLGEGVADLRPTPRSIIDEGPQRTVFRYRDGGGPARSSPVLLVPPLAAPASCFDLRRGCSLAEHLLSHGHPTYLVDYGPISFSDRQLGLEHWIGEVIPRAVEAAQRDAGGAPIQLVGWCLGGIMSLLATAANRELAVAAVATVASPFDFSRVRLMAPIRPLAAFTGGRVVTALYRALGGAPAPLVEAGYKLVGIDKYVRRPLTTVQHLGDRDFLAQLEAVDEFMGNMLAYPGRTFGQLYHRFFIVNELAGGRLELPGGVVDLADVRVPVLAVAGRGDGIAPEEAVHAVVDLLPNAPSVRYETAPGGHLGVLTGRAARDTTWVYLDEFLSGRDAAPAGEVAAPAVA